MQKIEANEVIRIQKIVESLCLVVLTRVLGVFGCS